MTTRVSTLRKTAIAALAASVIGAGVTTISATSAEAQWRPRHAWGHGYGYKPNRGARGAAVAAGIIGGLAAGALIAGAANPAYAAPSYGYAQPQYYQPAYGGYAQPSYSYGAPAYAYQPTCYTRRVRQQVDYDTVVIRRVRVCE
jgi:hypothetical protein